MLTYNSAQGLPIIGSSICFGNGGTGTLPHFQTKTAELSTH